MRLSPPTTCSLTLVDDVVAERQRGINAGFFSGIANEWRERVRFYIEAEGSPAAIQTWPDIEHKKNSFLNLYLSPAEGSVQGRMLDTLRDHNLLLCPACGEAGAPNTLDHYLPKERYPHFCVTPHNLFPMCDACQNNKGEKTGDMVNPKFFLHPYFDVFVAEQVLELKIQEPFDTPTFDLGPVTYLTQAQASLVACHARELEIIPRYARFFRVQYGRLLRLVHKLRSARLNVVDHLKAFQSNCETPTKNAWDHIFYSSALSNQFLLSYLQNHDLPAFL